MKTSPDSFARLKVFRRVFDCSGQLKVEREFSRYFLSDVSDLKADCGNEPAPLSSNNLIIRKQ